MGLSCSLLKAKPKQKITEDGKYECLNSVKNSQSNKFTINDNNNETTKGNEKKSKSKNKSNVNIKKNIRKNNSLGAKETKTTKNSLNPLNKINSIKNIDKYNQKEKNEEENDNIKNKRNKLRRSNIMKSYMPKLNIENNYYIVCPSCQLLFPDIKEINYDKGKKDFNVFYTCKCNNSKKLNKSMFLNFINGNRPHEKNNEFNQDEILEHFIQEINKKKDFEGKEMLTSAIQNSLDVNSAAPPAFSNINESIRDPSMIKSFFPNFKVSQLPPIKEEEDKNNKTINNKKELISHPINFQNEQEEDGNDFKEYRCIKTIKKSTRISSLIQLESELLCLSCYNNKIYILDINQQSDNLDEQELNEEGIAICLLEFKPNFLLIGTNENYISLWDLNSRIQEYIFLGHQKWVNGLVKCNEEVFASCSNDKNIIIWDFINKKLIKKIQAHDDCIMALIKLNNGKLCSGSCDLIIKIWNWQTSECLYKYEGFENWIRCLCQFDEQTLLVGSDKTITVWKNREIKGILSEHNNDVRDFCVIDENYFASASFDNTIKIWNINFLNCEQTLEGHSSNVVNIIKLKGSSNLASCSTDNTIKIWKKN